MARPSGRKAAASESHAGKAIAPTKVRQRFAPFALRRYRRNPKDERELEVSQESGEQIVGGAGRVYNFQPKVTARGDLFARVGVQDDMLFKNISLSPGGRRRAHALLSSPHLENQVFQAA